MLYKNTKARRKNSQTPKPNKNTPLPKRKAPHVYSSYSSQSTTIAARAKLNTGTKTISGTLTQNTHKLSQQAISRVPTQLIIQINWNLYSNQSPTPRQHIYFFHQVKNMIYLIMKYFEVSSLPQYLN